MAKEKKGGFFKKIEWDKPFSASFGYSVFGGFVALSVVLILLCCL